MDEATLIEGARRGELDHFNQLVLAYEKLAYNVAMRMLADADLAEDVTQTAFFSAYRNLSSFRGGSFKAWIMRMVTNACYDELRRKKRRPTVPLEPVDDEDEEIESPSWLADESSSPEEELEQGEREAAIQACLQGLDQAFRAVVVMIDIQEMDYAEASQILDVPLGTVKSRLARARLKLRDCLRSYWELLSPVMRLEDKK